MPSGNPSDKLVFNIVYNIDKNAKVERDEMRFNPQLVGRTRDAGVGAWRLP
jgi:hypothetical protein